MSQAKKQPKNPAAVALGHLGGKKGGLSRAARLTPQERQESARSAAKARMKALTPAERSALARQAAEVRWRGKQPSSPTAPKSESADLELALSSIAKKCRNIKASPGRLEIRFSQRKALLIYLRKVAEALGATLYVDGYMGPGPFSEINHSD